LKNRTSSLWKRIKKNAKTLILASLAYVHTYVDKDIRWRTFL